MNTTPFFTGVVEDINDPEQGGRVRIRIFGHHTPDQEEIPTSSLPWSCVSLPITSPSISGMGTSPTGLLPGSWVTGYFRDVDKNDSLIIGSLPGKSTSPFPGSTSFADPSSVYPLRDGIDTPAQADSIRYSQSRAYIAKTALLQKGIKMAVGGDLNTLEPGRPVETRSSWDQQSLLETHQPVYPHNHVTQSPGGHVFERDDTPGFERISEFHTSGTYREILPDGSLRTTITGDSHTVIMHGNNVYIVGDCNVTIAGDARTLVSGNYHLEVAGDYSELIHGTRRSKVGGNTLSEVGGDEVTNIGGSRKVATASQDTLTVSGDSSITVGGSRSSTIGGSDTSVTVGDTKCASGGSHLMACSGNAEIATGSGFKLDASSRAAITSGGATEIEAGGNVKVTGSQIRLND